MRGHINTVKRVKNGHANPNLDPMVGKISPDIMFWESWQKWSQLFADVCRCVQKGTTGYMTMMSVKNKSKRDVNSREGHFFDVWTRIKMRHVDNDNYDERRGSF